MDDGDAVDFTFCKVESETVNYHIESPKGIPDVNKITLEDNISDEMDLKKCDDSSKDKRLSSNPPTKFVASSSFSQYGSNGIKTMDSLALGAAGSNGKSLPEFGGQKPLLKKPAARAKVPFEKGYSQMDWLKLTRTHPDLAGLKGQTNKRLITMGEVKEHKEEGSMWTVLKGRVYNISSYMKFHPGGVDMLMMAVGKDCTSLFTKYHAWVNAEFLLEKCLVGLLDQEP